MAHEPSDVQQSGGLGGTSWRCRFPPSGRLGGVRSSGREAAADGVDTARALESDAGLVHGAGQQLSRGQTRRRRRCCSELGRDGGFSAWNLPGKAPRRWLKRQQGAQCHVGSADGAAPGLSGGPPPGKKFSCGRRRSAGLRGCRKELDTDGRADPRSRCLVVLGARRGHPAFCSPQPCPEAPSALRGDPRPPGAQDPQPAQMVSANLAMKYFQIKVCTLLFFFEI